MPRTLVIQSHHDPLRYAWLQACIDSVRARAQQLGYEYRYLDDPLLDFIDEDICDLDTGEYIVQITDINGCTASTNIELGSSPPINEKSSVIESGFEEKEQNKNLLLTSIGSNDSIPIVLENDQLREENYTW